MTTVKSRHRTRNRRHWSKVRTRGTSTGDPCSFRHTNGLLVELKVQTLYDRNTRRRTIKVYAGITKYARICARAERKSKKKCKNDVTDTPGIEHATSRARCVRAVFAEPFGLQNGCIYTALATKLLTNHGRGFRCVNGAQWSIHFRRFVAACVGWCLGTPHAIGTIGGGDFAA